MNWRGATDLGDDSLEAHQRPLSRYRSIIKLLIGAVLYEVA